MPRQVLIFLGREHSRMEGGEVMSEKERARREEIVKMLVPVREVARMFGLQKRTIQHLVEKGRLPAVWIDGRLFIWREDVPLVERRPRRGPRPGE